MLPCIIMTEIIEQVHNVSNHSCHVIRALASLVALCSLETTVCCDFPAYCMTIHLSCASSHNIKTLTSSGKQLPPIPMRKFNTRLDTGGAISHGRLRRTTEVIRRDPAKHSLQKFFLQNLFASIIKCQRYVAETLERFTAHHCMLLLLLSPNKISSNTLPSIRCIAKSLFSGLG
jgi:hypothetical protein